jgi:hypothetical protein
VKVISALLPSLPGTHHYTIIYMVRPTEQVVDSQWAMLARQGTQPKSEKQHLIEVQEHHSRQVREVLGKSDRATLVEVSLVQDAAYPQTTSSLRHVDAALDAAVIARLELHIQRMNNV